MSAKHARRPDVRGRRTINEQFHDYLEAPEDFSACRGELERVAVSLVRGAALERDKGRGTAFWRAGFHAWVRSFLTTKLATEAGRAAAELAYRDFRDARRLGSLPADFRHAAVVEYLEYRHDADAILQAAAESLPAAIVREIAAAIEEAFADQDQDHIRELLGVLGVVTRSPGHAASAMLHAFDPDHDDWRSPWERRDCESLSRHPGLVRQLALHGLACDDPGTRSAAIRPAARFLPPWESVPALAEAMRQGCARAALELSLLAPHTDGLVAGLADVLRKADLEAEVDDAARTLRDLAMARGTGFVAAALPAFREAVRQREGLFWDYAEACSDDADVVALHAELAAGAPWMHVNALRLVRERPALRPALVHAFIRGLWPGQWASIRHFQNEWLDSLALLIDGQTPVPDVFAALAAALASPASYRNFPSGWHRCEDDAARATREYLGRLPSDAHEECALLAGGLGRDPSESVWLVLADWLDEREDPRGRLLRLRHAIATGTDPEAAALRDAWLAGHGAGWDRFYDIACRPEPAPEADDRSGG